MRSRVAKGWLRLPAPAQQCRGGPPRAGAALRAPAQKRLAGGWAPMPLCSALPSIVRPKDFTQLYTRGLAPPLLYTRTTPGPLRFLGGGLTTRDQPNYPYHAYPLGLSKPASLLAVTTSSRCHELAARTLKQRLTYYP